MTKNKVSKQEPEKKPPEQENVAEEQGELVHDLATPEGFDKLTNPTITFFNFETVGQTLEGKFIGTMEKKGKMKADAIMIQVGDEVKHIAKSKNISDQFDLDENKIEVGDILLLHFHKLAKLGGKKTFKHINIYRKKSN